MTEVDDGVENQRIGADGLPSVHRIVGEEQHNSISAVGAPVSGEWMAPVM